MNFRHLAHSIFCVIDLFSIFQRIILCILFTFFAFTCKTPIFLLVFLSGLIRQITSSQIIHMQFFPFLNIPYCSKHNLVSPEVVCHIRSARMVDQTCGQSHPGVSDRLSLAVVIRKVIKSWSLRRFQIFFKLIIDKMTCDFSHLVDDISKSRPRFFIFKRFLIEIKLGKLSFVFVFLCLLNNSDYIPSNKHELAQILSTLIAMVLDVWILALIWAVSHIIASLTCDEGLWLQAEGAVIMHMAIK